MLEGYQLLILSMPILAAILISWMTIWHLKKVWRGAHPKYNDRLRDFQVIKYASYAGAFYGALFQWTLQDQIVRLLGYPIDALKAMIVSIVISTFASPFLFGVLLWFVLTPIDFKLWKKPAWRGLYDFLAVHQKKGVNYNDGKSDLTRWKSAEDEGKKK